MKKRYTDDSELSSKEKERLVFNYLRAHRNEFMKEDASGGGGGENLDTNQYHEHAHASSMNDKLNSDSSANYPANMYQHEKAGQVDKEHMYDDERLSMNTEGKIHRLDEEQVLSDGKPLRQAGGSHELPFELMQKTRTGGSDREGSNRFLFKTFKFS